jgi:hypothetical protein
MYGAGKSRTGASLVHAIRHNDGLKAKLVDLHGADNVQGMELPGKNVQHV